MDPFYVTTAIPYANGRLISVMLTNGSSPTRSPGSRVLKSATSCSLLAWMNMDLKCSRRLCGKA